MNPADIPEKLLAYLDGELAPHEAEAVRNAVAASSALERELAGLKLTAEFLALALKPAKLSPSELARLPGLAPAPAAGGAPVRSPHRAASAPSPTPRVAARAPVDTASAAPDPFYQAQGLYRCLPLLAGFVGVLALTKLIYQARYSGAPLYTAGLVTGALCQLLYEMGRAEANRRAGPVKTRAAQRRAPAAPAAPPRPPRIPPRIWSRIPHGLAASLAATLLFWAWTASSAVDSYVTVVARSSLVSDSPGSLQLVVRNGRHAPVAGQAIALTLSGPGHKVALGSWTSNSTGAIDANFRVPDLDPGRYALHVVADGWFDTQLLSLDAIDVDKLAQVLISPDKPLYQPGQVIHLRILARKSPSNAPLVAIPLDVTLIDPRDNKVFRTTLQTSAYGIASTSIPLADELTHGAYRIEVKRPGAQTSSGECVVTVKPYVLPPFRITAQPANQARYVVPKERTRLEVDAQYLFGKPVAGGTVTVTGATPAGAHRLGDAREWTTRRTASLDGTGKVEVPIAIPDVQWQAHVQRIQLPLQVSVTDLADHTETRTVELTVARQPILVEVVPVGGFRGVAREQAQGTPQPVVVSTCTADGQPVACAVSLLSSTLEVKVQTSALGLGQTEIDTSRRWDVIADHGQLQGRATYDPASYATRPLLLRSDKSYYAAGETMTLRLMGAGTAAFVDLVKDRQTYLTTSVALDDQGRGELGIPLASELSGIVSVHAYQVDARGVIAENTLEVFVAPAAQLRVQAALADAKTGDVLDTYRPGTSVRFRFALTDPAGAPVAGAISLAVIDKSVLALAETAPGLADVASQLTRDLGSPDDDRAVWERGRSINPLVLREPGLPEADRQAAMGFILARIAKLVPAVLVETNLDRQLALLVQHQASVRYWCGWLALLLPLGLVAWTIATIDLARQMAMWGVRAGGVALAVIGGLVVVTFFGSDAREMFFSSSNSLRSGRQQKVSYDEKFADVAFDRSNESHSTAEMDKGDGPGIGFAPPASAVREDRPARRMGNLDDARAGASPVAEPEMRVRKRFVETLVWASEIVTDAAGKADYTFDLADNITSWRALVEAVDGKGRLGTHESQLVTFQPFFARLDLPVHLTQHDRIELPIAVHNYAKLAQKITLEIALAPWFEVEGADAVTTLELAPEGVAGHKATLVAKQFGKHVLRITAKTADFADAIEREVEVVPDGERIEGGKSGRLRAGPVDLEIPADLTPGTVRAWLRVHPGVASDIQSGLEAMLKIPNGCFEQSSSTNYPNVLISRYLTSVDRLSPAVSIKIHSVLAQGLQKLLTFHDGRGGFGMYPGRTPQVHLTAYALMQLAQMAKVIDVEPALLAKVADRLKQDLRPPSRRGEAGHDPEQLAFACWAMLESGVSRAELAGPLDALARLVHDGRLTAYGEALALQSFVDEVDSAVATPLLRNYARLAEKAGDGMVRWRSEGRTMMHGYGAAVEIDTTALIARAMARRGEHTALARDAVNWLIQARDPAGLWVTTQSTALVLLALVEGAGKPAPFTEPVSIGVNVNGRGADGISIAPANGDVVHGIEITSLLVPGANRVAIDLARNDLPLTYTIAWRGYRDWRGERGGRQALDLDVAYPDRPIQVAEPFKVRVTYRSGLAHDSGPLMLALGVPPGCAVEEHLLRVLVNGRIVDRFEHRGRQVVLYLPSLAPGNAVSLEIGMRASRRLRGRTPESDLYAYYSPELRDREVPVAIDVR